MAEPAVNKKVKATGFPFGMSAESHKMRSNAFRTRGETKYAPVKLVFAPEPSTAVFFLLPRIYGHLYKYQDVVVLLLLHVIQLFFAATRPDARTPKNFTISRPRTGHICASVTGNMTCWHARYRARDMMSIHRKPLAPQHQNGKRLRAPAQQPPNQLCEPHKNDLCVSVVPLEQSSMRYVSMQWRISNFDIVRV